MKRDHPSEIQDRILKAIAAHDQPTGMRSGEIETTLGLNAGEVRMAMKWLADNAYVTGTKRRVKFNFGRQGSAFKPLMFWNLSEKGANRAAGRTEVEPSA